jgi:hypothetical protein
MAFKVAYFQPTVLALDEIPASTFVKIHQLAEQFHSHPELNDNGNPNISIRGGQQIQVYPNQLDIDVNWLVQYLEYVCKGYMDIVTSQSGAEELKFCKPVITSIWTIQQQAGDYQEMHSHSGGNISGNMYITAPAFDEDKKTSDGQVLFRLPQSKDITKFVMSDTWRYDPTPGTVVVFPSHIPHTVYPWKGTGTRTVIAFDALLRPIDE